MNADILNDLATRVEAGSADMQRELLNESWNALAQHSADFRTFARARCPGFWANASKFAVMLDAWAFESAAMTLVPEGLRFEVTTTGYRPGATVCGNILTGVHEGSYAATPALALTAACLRAHAAIAKENEGG